jgi:hypothetical protein
MVTASINTSKQPITEATFDKVYGPKFFSTYGDITRHGDATAANFTSAVAINLGRVFEQRLGQANLLIANDFENLLPNLGLAFDGEKVVAVLETDKNSTPTGKALATLLKKNKLPATLEGIKELARIDPFNPTFDQLNVGLFSGRGQLSSIEQEMRYLNKVVGTVRKLPDLAPHVMPLIEARVNNVADQGPMVVTTEDYNEVKSGDIFRWTDSEGNVHTEVK